MEREIKKLPDNITHYAQLKNSDYIGAWDLPEDGSAVKVTIEILELENVYNMGSRKKEWVNVIKMKGRKKAFIVNKTNLASIASWHGNNPKGWAGKEIDLIRTTTSLKGDTVECIRVVKNDRKKVKDASNQAAAAAQ